MQSSDGKLLPPKPPRKPLFNSNLNQISEQGNEDIQSITNNQLRTEFDLELNISDELPSWNQFFDEIKYVEIEGRGKFKIYCAGCEGPVIYCVHGGGYTGLTWALLAQNLKHRCQVIAPDLRGHGGTMTTDESDFSKENIAQDVIQIYNALFPFDKPPTMLVGHSMGGAMVVWAAQDIRNWPSLQGVVVLDVVEGTALASLAHMTAVLDKRPQQFSTVQDAIKWSMQSGHSKNKLTAKLQIPSQLQQQQSGIGYCWRTDLYSTQSFWRGWYEGLSESFLNLKVPKILILAGTDRLDKILTIGQMQGKFQQVMVPSAGHAIHEDEAEKVADILIKFLTRYKLLVDV
eukprot:TRINITY_DN3306_c0_g2_i1.p1 TRINITY_DN3306_c0_g2~~TRINITY_DN3306_c0_g2_i1.p1  ORF type:complete len:384 (-),score=35.81 TRINITY_DN3306_c0_g2_i1:81-1115(-)